GASSADQLRQEKVLLMRAESLDILVTSSILERGVSFKGVQVFVLGANHPVFNTAALVQIAGRAGRKIECPTGNVYFFHNGETKAIKQAIKQIKQMNDLAMKRGLIQNE